MFPLFAKSHVYIDCLFASALALILFTPEHPVNRFAEQPDNRADLRILRLR